MEEIILGGDNTAECIDGLRTNVQRKMYLLDQLFNKIKKLWAFSNIYLNLAINLMNKNKVI